MTDDDEIAAIAQSMGIGVLREERTTGLATLDQVALKAVGFIKTLGAQDADVFLTLQPTCPFIQPTRIAQAVVEIDAGAGCVITVVDDRHLGWRIGTDGLPIADIVAALGLPRSLRRLQAAVDAR
jgi:CMP-N-acetylneuraminic acid synthetase